jgi:uncharacterized protein
MRDNKSIFCLGLFFILFSFYSCNKDEINPDQIKEFTIESDYTGSDYDIYVVLPKNYNPDLVYETVYVLDGPSVYMNYKDVAEVSETKSSEYGKQNAIVVGVGGIEYRNRDFTPTESDVLENSGGCENYSKFIEYELIPKIENDYPVDTTAKSRVIIGHSLGGLCTGYFFTKHPGLFKNYLTLSPSIWYDDGVLLDYEQETRDLNSSDTTIVYIGCGEFEETIVILAQEWHYRLENYYPVCKVEYKKLSNLAHVSSAMKNVNYGLDFYYKNK